MPGRHLKTRKNNKKKKKFHGILIENIEIYRS